MSSFKDKIPFKSTLLEEERNRDIFTISLNKAERALLEACKPLIQQERNSTALKDLALIGASVVLHDQKSRVFLKLLIKNLYNNKRLGIPLKEPDEPDSPQK